MRKIMKHDKKQWENEPDVQRNSEDIIELKKSLEMNEANSLQYNKHTKVHWNAGGPLLFFFFFLYQYAIPSKAPIPLM